MSRVEGLFCFRAENRVAYDYGLGRVRAYMRVRFRRKNVKMSIQSEGSAQG